MKHGTRGAMVAAVMVLSGCGGAGLADDDPKGFSACSQFEKYRTDGEMELEELGAVGLTAAEAVTDGIRAAANPLMDDEMLKTMRKTNPKVEQIYLIDKDKFAAACADAGYKFS